MLALLTMTPEETEEFGFRIGTRLQAGDCLCLTGTLGAGKTLLAQGIARGLGVTDPVTSPTFTVLQVYQGRLPVYHYDLYRLRRSEELIDIGFDEYSGPSGVTLIEWPDMFPESMPEEALWVELSPESDGQARKITLTPHGNRYSVLLKELS
ncbi:tRNA (adenosine(37)-N6)-threonylcarbamoyltransferase complex ATPase subunit type 1 TsaE [Anaerosporomusa subterranea]|nr:tRNA (adenosine(37)-N6)-threonylcarbamoyltransferase complex ATPase subunit type 1 TsaE [Anaerosporomusa subterranea]